MKIEVMREGFTKEFIEDFLLGGMIEANTIIAFRRASGWVVLGRDSVRVQHRLYPGPERRKVTFGEDFSMV